MIYHLTFLCSDGTRQGSWHPNKASVQSKIKELNKKEGDDHRIEPYEVPRSKKELLALLNWCEHRGIGSSREA